MICSIGRFHSWPVGPLGGGEVLCMVLAIAGGIFTLVMLIDCLKRPSSKFLNPLTKKGEYDKLIWAAAIVTSAVWFWFLGSVVYFFVVRRGKPEKTKSE